MGCSIISTIMFVLSNWILLPSFVCFVGNDNLLANINHTSLFITTLPLLSLLYNFYLINYIIKKDGEKTIMKKMKSNLYYQR